MSTFIGLFFPHPIYSIECNPGQLCIEGVGTPGNGYVGLDPFNPDDTDPWDRGRVLIGGVAGSGSQECPAGTYAASDGCYGICFDCGGGSPEGVDTNGDGTPDVFLPPYRLPVATVKAKAIVMPYDTIPTCDSILAAVADPLTQVLTGVAFTLTPGISSSPQTQTQSGTSDIVWNNVVAGNSYEVTTAYTGDYAHIASCSIGTRTPTSRMNLIYAPLLELDVINGYADFVKIGPWMQTQGGNVYVGTKLTSGVPPKANPKVFALDQGGLAGSFPGIVTYGERYDVDMNLQYTGETMVSSKNWLVKDTRPAKDWYLQYKSKVSKGTTNTYDGILAGDQPPMIADQSPTVYLHEGNMSINSPWTISDADNLVVLISGNLTIRKPITLTGANKNGLVTFIVKGNITVDPTVGGLYTSQDAVVEGIYITNGTFTTGQSTNPGTERFVGKGTFVAKNFVLQRDLTTLSHNYDTSAELFIHNPKFYITFPDILKDLPFLWQEVAP